MTGRWAACPGRWLSGDAWWTVWCNNTVSFLFSDVKSKIQLYVGSSCVIQIFPDIFDTDHSIIISTCCNERFRNKFIFCRHQIAESHHRPQKCLIWATTARNYAYMRVMVRKWCLLTSRTVLTEWQPILTHVVSIFTVQVGHAEMSLGALRWNKLTKILLITKLSVIVSLPVTLIMTVLHCLWLHAGVMNNQITKQKLLTSRRIRAARGRRAAMVQDWTTYSNWLHVVNFESNSSNAIWQYLLHQGGEQYDPACLNIQLVRTDYASYTGVP